MAFYGTSAIMEQEHGLDLELDQQTLLSFSTHPIAGTPLELKPDTKIAAMMTPGLGIHFAYSPQDGKSISQHASQDSEVDEDEEHADQHKNQWE